MSAWELDAFLRDQMAALEAQRPGTARLRPRGGWDAARAAFTAAVADKTGVDAAFTADLLERRELLRQATHAHEAIRAAADAWLVSALMAAAAWTAAATRQPATRRN